MTRRETSTSGLDRTGAGVVITRRLLVSWVSFVLWGGDESKRVQKFILVP